MDAARAKRSAPTMLAAVIVIAGMGLVPPLGSPSPSFQMTAADGVHVYAQAFETPNLKAPVILLFHQAGSGKSEYAPIAPRLMQLGFNALAIDQRSGGDLYQPQNETVLGLGHSAAKYEEALPDMEAALVWAEKNHPQSPIFVWGSSYSAALVFLLAAKHPKEIAAVIAFSPSEYLTDKNAVHHAAAKIRVPVFIDSAADKQEIAAARSIYDAVPSKQKSQYVPRAGVHGSSTLRVDRNPSGSENNWNGVTRFLRSLSATKPR
jgi:dienelactone hydrolase